MPTNIFEPSSIHSFHFFVIMFDKIIDRKFFRIQTFAGKSLFNKFQKCRTCRLNHPQFFGLTDSLFGTARLRFFLFPPVGELVDDAVVVVVVVVAFFGEVCGCFFFFFFFFVVGDTMVLYTLLY